MTSKSVTELCADNPNLKETPAQFQEKCTQIALEILWEEATKEIKSDLIEEKPKIQLPKFKKLKRNIFGFKVRA